MLFAWNDSRSWGNLTTLLAGRRKPRRDLVTILTSQYEGVLVYHGCRVPNVNVYYVGGLQCSSSASLDKQAYECFLTEEFPEITPEKLKAITASLGKRDDGRIYACLDRRHLIRDAGHYLIYGSERLCAIAAELTTQGSRDYRQVLKRRGLPTLLHVALNWESVSDSDFEEFSELLAKNLSAIFAGHSLPVEMFTFEWWTDLPGSAILSHEHPSRIVDPLLGMAPYIFNE